MIATDAKLKPAKVKVKTTPQFPSRRDFLKLPMAERRRLLAIQAQMLQEHYRQDTERIDYQGGDLVEY